MITKQRHRDEAKRLLELDGSGQRQELLAMALAVLEDSRKASEELAALDRAVLGELVGQWTTTPVPETL